MAPLEPQEKDFDWQSQARMAFVPPEGDCLRAALPRLELLYDLPLLLSSAAALESERKCSVNHLLSMAQYRGERSKAASAGNSKSVQVQSRRKLRKANESQAKRQRR